MNTDWAKICLESVIGLLLFAVASISAEAAQLSSRPEENTERTTITLTMKSGPIPMGKKIYLNEVADCQGDISVCEETYGIEITEPVKKEKDHMITKEKVREIAQSEWPKYKILVDGSQGIKIIVTKSGFSEDAVIAQLNDALAAVQEDGQFTVSIEKAKLPSVLHMAGKEGSVAFPDLTDANLKNPAWLRKNLNGTQRIKISWKDAETANNPSSASMLVHFRLKEMVPLATHDIQRGDHIKETDITLAPYEYLTKSTNLIFETSAIIGRKARIAIAAGSPFAGHSVENIRVITRGQLAHLIINKGDLTITGKVQTLDSGTYGEVIDAIHPSTKKKLRVRIVDQSTVESMN